MEKNDCNSYNFLAKIIRFCAPSTFDAMQTKMTAFFWQQTTV